MKHYFITRWTFFFECWCNRLLKCVPFTYQQIFFGDRYTLTLIRLGGGHDGPPPRHIARLLGNARSSRRDTLWQFSFEFPAHFDTKFVMAGGTVPKLRNIVYMHVGPKMAPKCDFVYKINANWVFSLSSYKYAYFYSQLLKLISFWFIVLQNVSATNFGEKNNKNKRSKKQRNT